MRKKISWIIVSILIATGILSILSTSWINRTDCPAENRVTPNSLDRMPDTVLHVPLNIVLASGESNRVSYNETTINAMIEYSNQVWRDADIVFSIASVKETTLPDWRAVPLQTNGVLCQFGKDLLGSDFEDGIIDVVIVKDFLFASGGLTLNQGIVGVSFIEEFDDDYRANWTLVHELGHAMNLAHVEGRSNLMFNANVETGILIDRSTILTSQQIETARHWIYANHCPALSCIRE